MEYEQKVKEIGIKLVEQGFFQKPNYVAITHEEMARQILSLVEIKSDDQSTPENIYTTEEIDEEITESDIVKSDGWEHGVKAMCAAGFIRVIPKPKGNDKEKMR